MKGETITSRLLPLASPRRPRPAPGPGRAAALLTGRLAGAGLLAWIGYIHLHLWLEGYRFIPTDGPFFLLDAIVAAAAAAGLLLWPRPLTGLLSAGFTAATILALLISLTVGLFGFHESAGASFVTLSLVIEVLTVIVLAAWTVLAGQVAGVTTPAPPGRSAAATARGRPARHR